MNMTEIETGSVGIKRTLITNHKKKWFSTENQISTCFNWSGPRSLAVLAPETTNFWLRYRSM